MRLVEQCSPKSPVSEILKLAMLGHIHGRILVGEIIEMIDTESLKWGHPRLPQWAESNKQGSCK